MSMRVLFSLVLIVPLVTSCCGLPNIGSLLGQVSITGSGNVVTQEFDLSGFDRVEVSHAFDVKISQGSTYRVAVRVDGNVAEHLQIVTQGRTLKIGLKPRVYNMVNVATMEAEVTMPDLVGVELSGATGCTVSGFESAAALDVDVSGASSLQGDIAAGDATFDVSGASKVTLSGAGGDARIDVSGASTVDLGRFSVADANVQASGASHVLVNSSGTLVVDASGASTVRYRGSPSLGSVESTGGSTVGPD
jgi:hypothetical protein